MDERKEQLSDYQVHLGGTVAMAALADLDFFACDFDGVRTDVGKLAAASTDGFVTFKPKPIKKSLLHFGINPAANLSNAFTEVTAVCVICVTITAVMTAVVKGWPT